MKKSTVVPRILAIAFALALFTGFASVAKADSYTWSLDSSVWQNGPIDNAGIFKSTLTGTSSLGTGNPLAQYSVCDELSQYIAPPYSYTPDAVVLISSSGHSNAHQVAYLVDTYLQAFAVSGTATDASSLQKAVWNLWLGNALSGDAGTVTEATSLIADANTNGSTYNSNTAIWIQNKDYQDQLMTLNNPIPEPVFYQMAGLLVMGGLTTLRARRRKLSS